MKKITLIILSVLISLQIGAKDVKYVFFLIGDGMGTNTVAATEFYKAAIQGKKGTESLNFHYFPVCSFGTHWCANSDITDSAASGTALATGQKTDIKHVGVDPDGKPMKNLSEVMRKAGRQVGIISSTSINDATPGAFYAHNESRNNVIEIAKDLAKGDYAFYAGKNFKNREKDDIKKCDEIIAASNLTRIGSVGEYEAVKTKAKSILLLPDSEHPFTIAIDRKEGRTYTSLDEVVRTAIDFLMYKDKAGKGFFLMAEGGEIDHCAHLDDAAGTVKEVLEFEKAIAVALEFYAQHPDETAILVTSDHDTGGAVLLGTKPSQYAALDYQTKSLNSINSEFTKTFKKNGFKSFEDYKKFISERTGLWDKIEVSDKEEKRIEKLFNITVESGDLSIKSDEFGYGRTPALIELTFITLQKATGIKWMTNGHTAGYVPVFYKGPRTELFAKPLDNTSYFGIIKELAGIRN